MESVLKGILEEELQRNMHKQELFSREFLKYPKGSLVVVKVHDDLYLYRKYRKGAKVISLYIGPLGSDNANNAYSERAQYLKLKMDIKNLKREEIAIRKALKIYG